MLFHVTFRPRPNHGHEEQKKSLALWANYEEPEGSEIKSFVMGPNSHGYLLVEHQSAEAVFESVSMWAGIYLDYEVVPVTPIENAVELLQKAVAARDG